VELKSGKVVGASPNIPGWTGVSLKQIFRGFRLPVYADNDANLMALAESRVGAARGYDGAICLTIGTGIGGGLILHGQVYRGADSSAGELGHTCIAYDGRLCRCGAKGCLEAYASVPALLNHTRSLLESSDNHCSLRENLSSLNPTLIFQAAEAGDRLAVQILEQEITYLSAGLASVVNLLNPEVIVVGGGFVEAGTSFLHLLEKSIKERAFPSAVKGLKVVRAKLGNDAGFIGAALYCLESLNN
jgi:glucokinase